MTPGKKQTKKNNEKNRNEKFGKKFEILFSASVDADCGAFARGGIPITFSGDILSNHPMIRSN